MPLEQLLQYQGINPKPVDFDAYWERAINQLNNTPDEISLTPFPLTASFAEAFELRFKGVGGSEVYVKYIRPKGKRIALACCNFTATHGSQVTGATGSTGWQTATRSQPWSAEGKEV